MWRLPRNQRSLPSEANRDTGAANAAAPGPGLREKSNAKSSPQIANAASPANAERAALGREKADEEDMEGATVVLRKGRRSRQNNSSASREEAWEGTPFAAHPVPPDFAVMSGGESPVIAGTERD